MSGPRAVDAWCQPIEQCLLRDLPEARRLFEQSHTDELFRRADINVSIADHVRMMDDAGIEQAMLCSWHRPEGVALSNDRVSEYCQAYPDRFFGVLSVDLKNPVQACDTIETYVRHHNFKALRVVPWLWNIPPNHKLYYPLFVKCIQLDIPFMMQVGHTGPLCPSEPGRPVPYIDEVALTFPQLKIVCGHVGYPWTEEMIGVAWKHPNVFIDTSAWLPRYYPKPLVNFMNSNVKSKVMFGTNFPQLPWKKCTEQLRPGQDVLKLKVDAYENFMFKNAQRVLKLPPFAQKRTAHVSAEPARAEERNWLSNAHLDDVPIGPLPNHSLKLRAAL